MVFRSTAAGPDHQLPPPVHRRQMLTLLTHLLGEMPQTQCQGDPIPRRGQDFSDCSHERCHSYNFQMTKITK